MGRSKFPGKPSKHVNKTRVNVLPCSINNISTSTGEVCSALGYSNKTGGDLEQSQTYHESTKEEKIISNLSQDIENKRLLTATTSANVKSQSPIARKRVSKRYALKTGNTIHNKVKSIKTAKKSSDKFNKLHDKEVTPLKTQKLTRPTTAKVSRRLNTRRQLKSSTTNDLNSVGKFVLPSRSLHSSRVIKPNKRFITIEQNCNSNRVELRTFKKNRVIKKVDIEVTCSKDEQTICAEPVDSKCPKVQSDNSKCDENETFNDCTRARTPCSNGRVVLRQARLQLHSQASSGLGGPFSSHSVAPGTVTCGVCGAVRFYRFVKQARKFNIYSCESCRKFISKMIKRQTCSKSSLVCHKGLGMCHVPPIVRSQQWKLIRCAYRARCPACWLKMCLRSFQMPAALKSSLARLLPDNMQAPDSLFTTSLLTWQPNPPETATTPPAAMEMIKKESTQPQKTRPTRSVQPPLKSASVSVAPDAAKQQRQKIDLKGPRVKHVCRSASIVLGQPLAMFPSDQDITVNVNRSSPSNTESTSPDDSSNSCTATADSSSAEEAKTDIAAAKIDAKVEDARAEVAAPLVQKKLIATNIKLHSNQQQQQNVDAQNLITAALYYNNNNNYSSGPKKSAAQLEAQSNSSISIDFWESYDPDEVCRSGLGLTSSEPFPMQAVCFLCGSAGKEQLLHCSLCCEPYHSYCLAQGEVECGGGKPSSWTCPRCTTCTACAQPDRQKINCQKCHKAYHPECFNTKWRTAERPTLCSTCLRCKSCGADNITKFVGNLPLCMVCFKLCKKGNFCPLCQGCYDENDFNTKMMECAKCSKWIHSKCEGLTDEQYQVLSILPETVEYLCCICSSQSTPGWRKALDSELKASYNNVLRLLSKNQTVRKMLRWSPCADRASGAKAYNAVRKLHFQDYIDDASDLTTSQRESLKKSEYSAKSAEMSDSCSDQESGSIFHTLSMIEIKNKLNSNEIQSLKEFNEYMERALGYSQSDTLTAIYHSIIKEVFPWYDPSKSVDEDPSANKSLLDNSQLEAEVDEAEPDGADVLCSESIYRKKHYVEDTRKCAFCKEFGDGSNVNKGRLLFCGQSEWVHANCALWSAEVYEEIDGSLQNVHSALNRSRSIRCAHCKQRGASVGCCAKTCSETYHFGCARTADCTFMHDKTVYCNAHPAPAASNVVVAPKDFDIRRSVYVELDKKKKRFADPERVYFMVGSLSVTSLGTIIPLVSDTAEAIIPSGFTCSRLFWSTVEPWKLVSYVIKTSVLTASTGGVHVDKNFTVDHSLPAQLVNQKLRELLSWQKELDAENTDNSGEDSDEEPQNTADLLPPELTDAILEDIPHDLLDGISMQDIFPKLMSYEDSGLLNMDLKGADFNGCCTNDSTYKDDGDSLDARKKGAAACSVDYDMKNRGGSGAGGLKRSKSEVFSELANDKLAKARNHQRSCSLTWSCKLDNSLAPTIKKRKIVPRETSMFVRLLQVDGAYDSSSGSECGSPNQKVIKEENRFITLPQTDGAYDSDSDYSSSARNINGACDSSSGSDVEECNEQPVQCHRCQRIYRTNVSYKRHLSTCDVMSSESDSEQMEPDVMLCGGGVGNQGVEQCLEAAPVNVLATQSNHVTTEPYVVTAYESISTYQTTQNEVHSSFVNTQMVVKSSQEIPIAAMPESQPQVVYQSFPYHQPEQTVPQTTYALTQPIQIQHSAASAAPIINLTASNPVMIDSGAGGARWMKSAPAVMPKTMLVTNKSSANRNSHRARPQRSLAIKRNTTSGTIVLPHDNNQAPPTVIMQHLTAQNMLPTYVDAFQQQTGQNLQYVATISPTVIPGMTAGAPTQFLQLQSDNSLVGLLSGMQPTMIIQQPRMDQVLVDTSGSVMLATQPVYYGFETIVQNTVMSSQQFVPTALPGILATNSSYSATTQVFQTSKIEPVMDVQPTSYVLLNSGQLVSSQSLQQLQQQQTFHAPVHQTPMQVSVAQAIPTPTCTWKVTADVAAPKATSITTNANSITLPVAPYVPEQGIPMNIVTPIPQVPPPQVSRPMNRVLPMQTVTSKELAKSIPSPPVTKPAPDIITKLPQLEKEIISTMPDAMKPAAVQAPPALPPVINIATEHTHARTQENPAAPLKLVFQKQHQEGIYKISNRFGQNHVQIAPLKPIKPKQTQQKATETSAEKREPTTKEAAAANGGKTIFVIAEPKLISDKQDVKTPAIMYTVESQDGFRYSSTSICELWSKVFEAVQATRAEHHMAPLPQNALTMMSDLQLLGLKTNGLRYLLEQLPGAARCINYKPNFHFPHISDSVDDDYVIGHSSGAVRCCPRTPRYEPYDMFSWLASKHRKPEHSIIYGEAVSRRAPSVSLPMPMRFRLLKDTSKVAVGVYKSRIHGRGLFCLRDIESGEMVIEYAGEVIRSILTDKREKYYNAKDSGCYMFRIDDNLVVDATMKGNSARFINHSCDPNCYSKVLEILGHKHILIFALRRISRGEELTYDYKFPFEEDKIPCTCGAKRCRKFLN